MKRVFTIGERVWYEDDHENGWGTIVLINRSKSFKRYPCCDDGGDILTIQKEGCASEIESTPSRIYQVADRVYFHGEDCVWEHNEEIDYPLYCPEHQENCYFCETYEVPEDAKFSVWVGGGEVNDHYLTEPEARRLARSYKEDGYDDVQIVECD